MRFMVISTPRSGGRPEEIASLLPAERARLAELKRAGIITGTFIAQHNTAAFLLLQAESDEAVEKLLRTFPLDPFVTWQVYPLAEPSSGPSSAIPKRKTPDTRLDPTDALVLFADLQVGIADLPLTVESQRLRKSVRALGRLARIFQLPAIVTTVPGQDGAPAKLLPELGYGLGTFTQFQRTTPDTFDDAELRQAIEATGRRTLLVSGVATEVAAGLPCLSAAAEGYTVYLVTDACGGVSPRTEEAMLKRLALAGVRTTSVPTLCGELAGDFRQPAGQKAIEVLFELAGS
jgi:nicotinamidase-related amidase/muconolactone delta-isomerase